MIGKYIKDKISKLMNLLFSTELGLHHRLLNLILSVAFVGGCISCIISYILGIYGCWIILLIVCTVLVSLAIANGPKKHYQLSCMILVVLADVIIFPIMYFFQGGRNASMPMWLILGLAFPWLILEGKSTYIFYGISLIACGASFWIEQYYPNLVVPLSGRMAATTDLTQALVVVTLIIGIIFKYQSHVYEKQKEKLVEQDAELRKTLLELQKANEAKSTFLANMSHEIRTPINAVLGMNEMILRETKDQEIYNYANDIEQSGQNLLAIINDILDFSKIESGKMELVCGDYKLKNLIMDCYNAIKMRVLDKDVKFIFEADKNTPSVFNGDITRVKQILTNILTNAAKYTDKGSITLKLTCKKVSDDMAELTYEIIDTGRGITEEGLKVLFDSFQRVDMKKNRNIEGTGLGLAIVKQLVGLMGGQVEVTSEYQKGTCFKVMIPQKIVDETPIGEFIPTKNENAVKKEFREGFHAKDARILVVDDVNMNLKVVKALLKKSEIVIDTALSGAEALDMYKENDYDLIYMDHMMPNMDGIEAFHEIQKMEKYQKKPLPIIVLTANAVAGAREEYEKEGFTDYISKPIAYAELEAQLLKYLPKEKVERN